VLQLFVCVLCLPPLSVLDGSPFDSKRWCCPYPHPIKAALLYVRWPSPLRSALLLWASVTMLFGMRSRSLALPNVNVTECSDIMVAVFSTCSRCTVSLDSSSSGCRRFYCAMSVPFLADLQTRSTCLVTSHSRWKTIVTGFMAVVAEAWQSNLSFV
jgi:hypothetical protein